MPESDSKISPSNSDQNLSESNHAGQSIHDTIRDIIQDRIRQGDWLPGERLPSIAQLSKEFHVGTGSIREAMRALQSVGLVKIEQGSGIYVTSTYPTTEFAGHFQKVGEGLTIALGETRSVLEPELAALAAERATDEELSEIENLAHLMEMKARNGETFADLDVLFHRQIAKAARNPILYQTIEGVSDLFLQSRRTILLDPEASMRAQHYHILIADALQSRNAAQARLLMQGHMNSMMSELAASEARKKIMQEQNEKGDL